MEIRQLEQRDSERIEQFLARVPEGDRTFFKENVDSHFSQHERTPAALASVNRQLDRALDLLVDCVRRYYWIVSDSYIDVDVSYADDPLAVLRFPWIEPQ